MGAKWKAKAIIQKGISFLPAREKVNFMFQKYVTKGVRLEDEHFGYKVTSAMDHIAYLKDHDSCKADNHIVELGTGWYPIVPIFMWLKDAGHVTSIDIQSWMTQERQLVAINKAIEWRDNGKLDEFFPELNEEKWSQMVDVSKNPSKYTMDDICNLIGLKVQLIDARKTNFETDSIDFICSNNTFEHIHIDVLKGILKEFNRIVKKDGLMSHFIDMSDHFAHFDHSINIYNFLKYSKKKWKRIDNNIQPQNRMRFKDYLAFYEELNIPVTSTDVRPGSIEDLKKVHVHQEWADYSEEDLAVSHGYIVSRYGT